MEETKINELCDLFMRRMRIEGDDGSERDIVLGYVRSGILYLTKKGCDLEPDFENDTDAKELLYNYVFYSRNECLAEFERNYGAQLRALRNAARVKARRAKENEENEECD